MTTPAIPETAEMPIVIQFTAIEKPVNEEIRFTANRAASPWAQERKAALKKCLLFSIARIITAPKAITRTAMPLLSISNRIPPLQQFH